MITHSEVTDYVTALALNVSVSDVINVSEGQRGGERQNETETVGLNVVGAALVGTLLTAVVLCTVLGNVLVLLAVFVNSHLRSTTNYFIVNLAIADLLLGTTVLPFSATLEVFKKWLFGPLFCDIWAAIDVLCCTASIFSLCVISIDRYIGVTRPLQRCSIMTERRAVYVIVVIWLLALAISVAPLVGWKEDGLQDPLSCTVTTHTSYVLFSVSASFYIPLSIILLVYFRIYREAVKHSRFLTTGVKTTKIDDSGVTLRVHKGGGSSSHVHHTQAVTSPRCCHHHHHHHHHQHQHHRHQHQHQHHHHQHYSNSKTCTAEARAGHQSSSSSDRSESSTGPKTPSRLTAAGKAARFKRETKAAKTLGIVVGVFILCWFPFFFILPLGSLCQQCNIPPLLFTVFFWLGYCNSLMNPVIYACSSREFQFAFRRILRCQFRRRPRVFLNDQESSSCPEIAPADGGVSMTGGAAVRQTTRATRSSRRGRSRRDRVVRIFRSNKRPCRHNTHKPSASVSLHGLDSSRSAADLQGSDSPSEGIGLHELQRHLGEEFRRQRSSLTSADSRDWPPDTSHTDGTDWPTELHSHADTRDWPTEPNCHKDTRDWPTEPHCHKDTRDWPTEPHSHADTRDWPTEPHSHADTRDWPTEPHSHADTRDWAKDQHVPTSTDGQQWATDTEPSCDTHTFPFIRTASVSDNNLLGVLTKESTYAAYGAR